MIMYIQTCTLFGISDSYQLDLGKDFLKEPWLPSR